MPCKRRRSSPVRAAALESDAAGSAPLTTAPAGPTSASAAPQMPRKRRRSSPVRQVAPASDAADPVPPPPAPAGVPVGKHGFDVRLELATANALQDMLTDYRAAYAEDFLGPPLRGSVALEPGVKRARERRQHEKRLAETLIQRVEASIVCHMDNALGQLARAAARTTRAAERARRLAAPGAPIVEAVVPNPNADAEAAWVRLTSRRAKCNAAARALPAGDAR
jgi:hypothetical protein